MSIGLEHTKRLVQVVRLELTRLMTMGFEATPATNYGTPAYVRGAVTHPYI